MSEGDNRQEALKNIKEAIQGYLEAFPPVLLDCRGALAGSRSKNIAITHVGNKMLRILWHMLMENRLYDQRNEERYESKLKNLRNVATD